MPATATRGGKKKSGRSGSSNSRSIEIPVEFGGVSIGDGTARLGLKIDRENLNIDAADEALCGRRLKGRVILGNGDAKQKEFVNDRLHSVSSVFDVKRFGVAPKVITCGLTFSLQEIDVKELSLFAKKKGRFVIDEIGAIPEEESADGDGDSDSDEDDKEAE